MEQTRQKRTAKVLAAAFSVVLTLAMIFAILPAQAEGTTVDLSALTANYEAKDGETLTGTLAGNYKISIADGATVTLKDVTINGVKSSKCKWAGITCNGNATIILSGENTVTGFYEDYPGILVPANKTLTIQGDGALTASAGQDGFGAGIGGMGNGDCGSIVIEGGTITAIGSVMGAGIGNAGGKCGDITITGGTVIATGGSEGAGIGGGATGTCGNITIANTVTKVTATKGENAANSIGIGNGGSCGTVTIGGEEIANGVTESPYTYEGTAQAEEPAYYLWGSMMDWNREDRSTPFSATETEGVYSVTNVSFSAGAEFKVLAVLGESNVTYPEGMDNAYTVEADGTYNVYFRPAGDGAKADGWHEGYIKVEAAVVETKVDLSALTSDYVAQDGEILTGTLGGNYKLSIAGGATVTLDTVTINCNKDAGLTCNNATLILKGKNTVRSSAEECPGILVADYSRLTISGDGSLEVYGAENAAGIGGRFNKDCGTIVIESGTITAHGGTSGAGIGSGNYAACSGIEISGGIVKAYGGEEGGAGIGTGAYASYCAYINISGGRIYAQGTDYEYDWGSAGIGTGVSSSISSGDSTCEKITITGGNIEAVGGPGAAAIGAGSGYKFYDVEMEEEYVSTSECNEIVITDGVGKLKATKGSGSPQTIGGGKISRCTWGVKVLGGGAVSESPYNYLSPGPAGVIVLIDEIPNPVNGSDACKKAIEAARAAYDKLATDEQKALVTNYDVLTAAEAVFAVAVANEKIDAIPAVENITLKSKTAIEAARAAYNALTDAQKAEISAEKVNKLTAAEAKYAEVKEADDTAKANNAMDKINAIGTVEYTPECKAKIDAARTAYDALTDDQKAKVDNYATLTEAESSYQVAETKALIAAIGEVEYTAESKAKIDAAKTAYDALTDDQKAKVTNYNTLTEAESSYQVAEVKAQIAAIGTVEYTAECKAKIDAANTAFDALNKDQQNKVNNTYVLVYAWQDYRILEATALINAIGEVEYTAESKEKIDAARKAYDDLGAKLQPSVTNAATLTDAEATYADLKADHDAADAVKAKIDAIGTVELTVNSKALIDLASEAYNDLTDDQKALVTNYNVLTTSEATYKALGVKDAIANIGTVEYTAESKAKIDAAKEAYNALTTEEKALVENYNALTTAESTYTTLKGNHEAAEAVKAQIEAIGTVEYNAESKAKIDAAKEAYNALTDDQKALVENYNALTNAESTYEQKAAAAVDPGKNNQNEDKDDNKDTTKKGLPGGVIALIVMLCLLVVACGAFAIVWFVVWKKTWAAFVALLTASFKKNDVNAEEEKTEEPEDPQDKQE